MADDVQRAQDAEANRRSYEAIMKWSAEIGLPACLAMAMFFTALVTASGVFVAGLAGIVTYFASQWVVRTFFTH